MFLWHFYLVLLTHRSKIAAAHMVNPRTLEYLVPADDAPSGLSLVFAITGTVDLNVAGLQVSRPITQKS